MTVVLLDPTRPDLIPVGAAALLGGRVEVTEDVHPTLLWQLPSFQLAGEGPDVDMTATLLSSDREHPAVLRRIGEGDKVVSADLVPGTTLMAAVELMDRLRRTGPWEQRQTHDSLRRYLVEEVYEVLDAIDHGNQGALCSELGDLLLQVLFHARIAADAAVDAFTIDDVAQSFISKVAGRTPGVLSGEHSDLDRQIQEWEDAKAAERELGSILDGVVTTQPALALTQKILERLAAADFPVEGLSPSLYQVSVPFRKHSVASVEDEQRGRALELMAWVRTAESAAHADGALLRDENTWRKYLGMKFTEPAAADDSSDGETTEAEEAPEPADRGIPKMIINQRWSVKDSE